MSGVTFPQVTVNGLVPIANNTVLGNVTGISALPTAVTQPQLTALINTFTSSLSGAVPAYGANPTSYLLSAAGTWVAPPAAATYVFLDSKTASSSATLDFTSSIDSTYSSYEFRFENVVPATDDAYLGMRFSTDGGSTYLTTNYLSASPTDRIALTNTVGANNKISNTANGGLSGVAVLFNPAASKMKQVTFNVEFYKQGAAAQLAFAGGGMNTGTTAVNAVRFLMDSGNISAGVIRMYGVKGS